MHAQRCCMLLSRRRNGIHRRWRRQRPQAADWVPHSLQSALEDGPLDVTGRSSKLHGKHESES